MNLVVGICRRESGESFPIVSYEHLLRLIGRSHSLAQAEEREERRWLDRDRGSTIFTSSAKKESRITESGGQIIYI